MKFFSVALVVALFCAVASAAPSPSPFANELELQLVDAETFGLTDIVGKILNDLIEKTKCTLDVIQDLIGDDSLKKVFQKFKADIESVVQEDALECVITEGLVEKLKCAVRVTKKVNSLFLNFYKEVYKTNKDLAVKVLKALYQCAKKQHPFISNEEADVSLYDDEETFGLTEIVTKILNNLLEKVKCTLDVLEGMIKDDSLKKVFQKFKADIGAVVQEDIPECVITEGLTEKLKCAVKVTKKVNLLFLNFYKEVAKTNKDLAVKIVKALYQCAKKQHPFISNEEADFSLFDNEETFGLTDVVSKLLDKLIETTKCALDAIEVVVGNGPLKDIFEKLRDEVLEIIVIEIPECVKNGGLITKLKCLLDVSQRVNHLFADFIKKASKISPTDVVKKVYAAFAQCVKKPSAPGGPGKEPEKPEEFFISSLDDEVTFDWSDTLTKILNALIEKTKCALDAIEGLLKEGKLRNVYKKLRAEFEAILKNDVQQCAQKEGVVAKLNCALGVVQKLNTLFADFLKEALKANKDVYDKILKAIAQCAKNSI